MRLVLHWRGGRHSELTMPKTGKGQHRYQAPEQVSQLLSEHSGKHSGAELAELLNERNLRTGHGHRWTAQRVRSYLYKHELGS